MEVCWSITKSRSITRSKNPSPPMAPTEAHAPVQNYEVVQMDALDPTRCPCGWSRRAFADSETSASSVHLVEILEDARTHYHKKLTETYVVLEGEGWLELDGDRIPLKPL